MKNVFYRPNLSEDREFLSEEEFIGPERDYYSEIDQDDSEEESTVEVIDFEDTKAEVRRLIGIIEGLPIELPFPPTLRKILDDIEDLETMIPEPEPDDGGPEPTPPKRTETDPIKVPDNFPIRLFPDPTEVVVENEKRKPIVIYSQESFIKDKKDMYDNFVKKLKLMIQQHIREVLYISTKADFDSYKDLYIRYLSDGEENLRFNHVTDRIIKSQIERDQKSRLLSKTFSIEQTIAHLISNKVCYEQRKRYYSKEYEKADDYLMTRENEELKAERQKYDKKYEHSMQNYYKYLNSSVSVAEEILKGFVSEARGKAVLKNNGIDPAAGIKKEEAVKAERQKQLQEETDKALTEAQEKREKSIISLAGGGKATNYQGGSYAVPMPDGSGGGGTSVQGTGIATGNGMYSHNITSDISSRIDKIRNDGTLTNGQKVARMAELGNEVRGVKSSHRITYSQTGSNKNAIFGTECKVADCSSFTQGIVMYALGANIGGYTGEQVTKNKGRTWIANASELQEGDLIFLKYTSDQSYKGHAVTLPTGENIYVNHVMIYVGNNAVVHCTKGQVNGIERLELTGWYERYKTSRFAGAYRL